MLTKQTLNKIAKLQDRVTQLGYDVKVKYEQGQGWFLSTPHLGMSIGKTFKNAENFIEDQNNQRLIQKFCLASLKEEVKTNNNEILFIKGFLASVQAEFEPIFWVHTDPETILKFAEKSICGRLTKEYNVENLDDITNPDLRAKFANILEEEYEERIDDKISKTNIIYKILPEKDEFPDVPRTQFDRIHLTRDEALSHIGKRTVSVQDYTNNCSGRIADIFTMQETKEQVCGPEFIDVAPFVARRVTASFALKEIK